MTIPSLRSVFLCRTPIGLWWCVILLLTLLPVFADSGGRAAPWDLQALRHIPTATWGERRGLVQEVYYEGESYQGRPTRVFAYYGQPDGPPGRYPAMLLVHGGGGKAFPEWAEHWAKRGYVALAMDLAGAGPNGRLPDGGPDQSDESKFRPFTDAEVRDMWTYHAVAAVIRGHSLLTSRPEVDADRIGITGISWGGYLTCILAGVDDRLKVAVPVYGCGFLHENSVWLEPRFAKMTEDQRRRWVRWFDPSQYLNGVECPILFLNGSNDFAYPLDSYRKSYRLVRGPCTVSVQLGLPHGHIWSFREVDVFVDRVLQDGQPMPRLAPLRMVNDQARTRFRAAVPAAKAALCWTTDSGPWQKRTWQSLPAEIRGKAIHAPLPRERPAVCFITLTDTRGLTVSTPHVELRR